MEAAHIGQIEITAHGYCGSSGRDEQRVYLEHPSQIHPSTCELGGWRAEIATVRINKRKSNLFYRFYYLNIDDITLRNYYYYYYVFYFASVIFVFYWHINTLSWLMTMHSVGTSSAKHLPDKNLVALLAKWKWHSNRKQKYWWVGTSKHVFIIRDMLKILTRGQRDNGIEVKTNDSNNNPLQCIVFIRSSAYTRHRHCTSHLHWPGTCHRIIPIILIIRTPRCPPPCCYCTSLSLPLYSCH